MRDSFKGTNHWIKVSDITLMGLLCFIWNFQELVASMLKYYCSPPALTKESNCCRWKKELQIWETVTSLASVKNGPAVFRTLTGETREAMLILEFKIQLLML